MKKLRPLIDMGEMTGVPVYTRGVIIIALIDNEDAELVSKYLWSLTRAGYAKSGSRYAQYNGYIHRVIMQPAPYEQVDHKDGDRLNNRRSNLRIVTNQQNQMARHVVVAKSGYKGVVKLGSNYKASIKYNQKQIRLGTYKTPEKAARAYNQAALALFGEHAVINKLRS